MIGASMSDILGPNSPIKTMEELREYIRLEDQKIALEKELAGQKARREEGQSSAYENSPEGALEYVRLMRENAKLKAEIKELYSRAAEPLVKSYVRLEKLVLDENLQMVFWAKGVTLANIEAEFDGQTKELISIRKI